MTLPFNRNPTDAQVTGEIDCSRDIRIGRSKTQMVSAENLANDAGWRHLAYTADGNVAQLDSGVGLYEFS